MKEEEKDLILEETEELSQVDLSEELAHIMEQLPEGPNED